eukprot:GFUD01020848.1.p1 GENE.GFUD01020848.1~~GFUD01020848.1.p1  ORF type:complete len:823 (+),score=169.54 GFUD01020848.1:611-3079(+)
MESDCDAAESEQPEKAQLHRPMNAYLLFCKHHRRQVRDQYPSVENRQITKILGEWWSYLEDQEKEPYTTLAHQYKEAFMKANPDFRWRKMPPGSAESLPPSNAKPSTPSPTNGVSCSKLLPTSSLPVSAMPDGDPPSQPSAPKPFKKRYLATQHSTSPSSPGHTPPSPQTVTGVSPEAARACEALMELARTESRGSRSSDGSDRRGSPSETQPFQTLREAVWSKVAGTLLKQEEEKLVVPPKDSPMNLSSSHLNQCTIRGQQIIEHIIENILDMPMDGPMDPSSEPISFSLNNNQEVVTAAPHSPPITHASLDVGDSIKASIYESLKNDLLMGKTPPMGALVNSTPSIPGTSRTTCPTTQPDTVVVAQNNFRKLPKKLDSPGRLPPTVSSLSPVSGGHSGHSPSPGQDVLRLLGSGQLPISVGNSAITITKTPRVSLSGPASHPSMSFPVSVSSTPVSLSLTRAGTSQVFSLSSLGGGVPVVLTQPSMMLSSHPPQGSVVLQGLTSQASNVVLSSHPTSECVLLSPAMAGAGQGMVLQGQPGMGGVVLSSHHQPGQVVLAPATGQPLLIAGLSGGKLILAPSPQHSPVHQRPAPSPSPVILDNTDPVNLTVTKPAPPSSPPRPVSHSPAPGKRPAPTDLDDEDIRRSSRVGRGRRYQEFIEDGRISVGSRKIRRSHRSGEDLSESEVEPDHLPQHVNESHNLDLPTSSELTTSQINHWKKKMRTASLGENTQSELLAAQLSETATATVTAKSHFDLDAKMGALEPLSLDQFQKKREEREAKLKNRSSGSSRSTRQSQPEKASGTSKAFDARVGSRKVRGEKI